MAFVSGFVHCSGPFYGGFRSKNVHTFFLYKTFKIKQEKQFVPVIIIQIYQHFKE